VPTLATLRTWPPLQSPQVLFRYGQERRQLIRRDGLSEDVVSLRTAAQAASGGTVGAMHLQRL